MSAQCPKCGEAALLRYVAEPDRAVCNDCGALYRVPVRSRCEALRALLTRYQARTGEPLSQAEQADLLTETLDCAWPSALAWLRPHGTAAHREPRPATLERVRESLGP